MKKVRRFPYERIPAFIVYGIVAVCAVGTFTVGRHCFFLGICWYVVGKVIDPNSDLHDRK